jgi:N-acetylglutamate synthase-like GNAT family acetyltransferase/DNA-binding MarR family transcriptional regulator
MNDILNKLGFLSGGSRFRRIYERLQIGGDKVYKDAGVEFKSTWFPVYYVLANSVNPQTVMEIAGQISFSHITVKNIVKELDSVGLTVISPNPDDGRSKLIALSKKGKALQKDLEPIWMKFSNTLERVMKNGHPDITNILVRIDKQLSEKPLNDLVNEEAEEQVKILDYRPNLKHHFYDLAGYWLLGVTRGKLEEEDEFTLRNPDKAYLENGGFLFFAQYKGEIVGCVALKRLDDDSFEFAKLFVDPAYRGLGIARKLVERCICRCKENAVKELWLQSTAAMKQAHSLYYKMGFVDQPAPAQMNVLARTEKIMAIDL